MLGHAARSAVCFDEHKETTREIEKESYVMKWIDVVAAALRLICFPKGETVVTERCTDSARLMRLSHACGRPAANYPLRSQ